jgi:hypothetical protein
MFASLLCELVSYYVSEIVTETHFRNMIVLYIMPQAIKLIEMYYFDTSFYIHIHIYIYIYVYTLL